jgi:hypothetical protein
MVRRCYAATAAEAKRGITSVLSSRIERSASSRVMVLKLTCSEAISNPPERRW